MASDEQERWQKIEALFHEASLMAGLEQSIFLDAKCENDPKLREDLASLLASSDRTLAFLQRPVLAAVDGLIGVSADLNAGQFIGPYKVVRLLGMGGMGRVYLAERGDSQYRRQVAIKTVQPGQLSPENLLARFRAERQILADLNHPNIARLLDGGVTPEGTPYIVMEYIQGEPIHSYCRERRLPVADRLRLFSEVCSAVDYAHRHLVVHRDLKPANVMVTHDGVPKLLDFGIAKLLALDPAETPSTLSFERLLTPDYASPEQLLGHPVTTATDVYGLGALLYELLCGVPPFAFDPEHPLESARVICEVTPEPPSAKTGKPTAPAPPDARIIKGDLDRIVLMALRKEPQRRYPSAMRFAEDVDAWLRGYPVQARTSTWTYVAGSFVRRHRWAVATSAVALVALIGFSIAMAYLSRRSDRQQTIASQQAEFLAGMFQAATPESSKGRTVTARELLDIGARRIEDQTGMDPAVRAALIYDIAKSYRALGEYNQALKLSRQSYEIRSGLSGAESPTAAAALGLLASSYRDIGDFRGAEPLFRRLLSIRKASERPDSIALENAYADLGECLYWENSDAEAEPLERQALAIDHRNPSVEGANVRNYLALILEREAAFPEAARLLREAVGIDGHFDGADSPDYANSLSNLGGAQIDAGDLAGAEATYREALALRRKVLGNDHPDLAYTLNNLAYVLLEKGDGKSALPLAQQAVDIRIRHLGDRDPVTASTIGTLGRAFEALGDYASAEAQYERSLSIFRLTGSPDGLRVTQILSYEAQLQFDRGHYAEAEKIWQRVLEARQKTVPNSTYLAATLIDVAQARLFQHDAAGAVPLLREAVAIRASHYPATHPLAVAAKVRLGEALWLAGSPALAQPVLEDALHLAQTAPYPLFAWQIAEAQSALGAVLKVQGKNDDGAKLLAESRAALAADPRPIMRIPADLRYRN